MAPHILLEELGLPYQLEKVNLDTKAWAAGDYNALNPKSYVPALKVNDQPLMTECAVILEFIGRQSPQSHLPAYNTQKYWEQRIWLNYIATELHKNFISPFRKGNWLPNTADSKQLVLSRVKPRLAFVEQHLAKQGPYLMGEQLCIADPYLFVMTNWLKRLDYSFEGLPNLQRFDEAMRSPQQFNAFLNRKAPPTL